MSIDWRTIGQQVDARSRKGTATRQRMIEAAADLFAERGIDRVSPGEILKAAGRRNASAIQYHFGSREGLVVATLQPRPDVRDGMDRSLAARLDELEAADEPLGLEDVVRAWVDSTVLLLDTRQGRSFLRVAIQVIRTLPIEDRVEPRHPSDRRAHALVLRFLADLPPQAAAERLGAALTLRVEMLANRARDIEQGVQPNLPLDAFTSEMATMVIGLLTARASSQEHRIR